MVANPGHSVSIRDDTNLKLTVIYLRHQARISIIVAPAIVALTFFWRLRSTKDYEENFKVTSEQPIINEKDWPRTMEANREFFRYV
jgi:C4-dicarboxylate transporter